MSDLEYRCVHGHDKCAEMYPGPECPYCERITDLERAYALVHSDPEHIEAALAAARREGAEEMRKQCEAVMEAFAHRTKQTGAEEMRERAAELAEVHWGAGGPFIADDIRKLPLTPEER